MVSPMSHNDQHWPSMEAHGKPHYETTQPKFTAVNSYLWTPDEPTADSFSADDKVFPAVQEWQTKLPPFHQPATPPESPLPDIASATGFHSDKPLYPDAVTDGSQSQAPLFPQNESSPPAPRARSVSSSNGKATLPVLEPEPWPFFGVQTSPEAREYFNIRINELREVPKVRRRLPPITTSRSPERDGVSQQQVQRLSKSGAITKPRTHSRTTSKPKAPVATSPVQRSPPPRRRTPKAKTTPAFLSEAWPNQQQPAKHKRAPPSKKVEDAGVRWSDLPDYAPPVSSLDSMGKKLTASWTGNPRDPSGDQDFDQLHPEEAHVAAVLRLECDRYLYNKRKIFQARLQALKDGKNFTKTAAQGACNIDVNKASQLWEAFEKVGWFKESWYDKYL